MRFTVGAMLLVTLLAADQSGAAIIAGQTDNFQDGSIESWDGGTIRTNEAGPTGENRYLEIRSSNRMASYNTSGDWTGDYASAGIAAIEADMITAHGSPLSMRIVLFGPGSSDNRFTSTEAVTLPNDGEWHRLTFPVEGPDLTRVKGSTTYDAMFANVGKLMFRHQAGAPEAGGNPIGSATLGIDNIRAVPEPTSLGLVVLGSILLSSRKRTLR